MIQRSGPQSVLYRQSETIVDSCTDLSLGAFTPLHVVLNNYTLHKQFLSFSCLLLQMSPVDVNGSVNRRNLSAPYCSFVSKSPSLSQNKFLTANFSGQFQSHGRKPERSRQKSQRDLDKRPRAMLRR